MDFPHGKEDVTAQGELLVLSLPRSRAACAILVSSLPHGPGPKETHFCGAWLLLMLGRGWGQKRGCWELLPDLKCYISLEQQFCCILDSVKGIQFRKHYARERSRRAKHYG